MSPRTNEIAMMFESMTEQEQALIFALMQRLAADDIATPEDIAAHEEADEAWRNGNVISLESFIESDEELKKSLLED